jgi:hypothetical protein
VTPVRYFIIEHPTRGYFREFNYLENKARFTTAASLGALVIERFWSKASAGTMRDKINSTIRGPTKAVVVEVEQRYGRSRRVKPAPPPPRLPPLSVGFQRRLTAIRDALEAFEDRARERDPCMAEAQLAMVEDHVRVLRRWCRMKYEAGQDPLDRPEGT